MRVPNLPLLRDPATAFARWLILAVAAPGLFSTGTTAADLRAEDGARLAAPCAGCHGTAGRAPEGSIIPALAGRDAAELSRLLEGYRSGERPSEEMARIARGYSADEIVALAAWFAAQSRRAEP